MLKHGVNCVTIVLRRIKGQKVFYLKNRFEIHNSPSPFLLCLQLSAWWKPPASLCVICVNWKSPFLVQESPKRMEIPFCSVCVVSFGHSPTSIIGGLDVISWTSQREVLLKHLSSWFFLMGISNKNTQLIWYTMVYLVYKFTFEKTNKQKASAKSSFRYFGIYPHIGFLEVEPLVMNVGLYYPLSE